MDSQKIKEEMLAKKSWAVVGVTAKKDKYGYKIWKTLKNHKYKTFGVNPNYDEIEGEKIYNNLKNIPEEIDVVDMVIPPRLSINVLDEIKDLGIKYIFFQPGTYNDEVVEKAKDLGFKYLIDDCIYATLKRME